jgi:hypothetical protein
VPSANLVRTTLARRGVYAVREPLREGLGGVQLSSSRAGCRAASESFTLRGPSAHAHSGTVVLAGGLLGGA